MLVRAAAARAPSSMTGPLVVDHEPFGHEHHGLRCIDGLQRVEQRAQHVHGVPAVDAAGRRLVYRFRLHFLHAEFEGGARHAGTLAHGHFFECAWVVPLDLHRLEGSDGELRQHRALVLANKPLDRALEARTI